MEVLQTSALPLGDGAGRNWGSKLTWIVRPRLETQPTATSGERVTTQGNRSGVVDWQTVVSSSPLSSPTQARAEGPRHPLSSAWSGASDEALAQRNAQEGPQGPTFQYWSGKRDSNPRLRPWQGRTLPLSYSRMPVARARHGRIQPAVQNLNRTIHLATTAR